MSTIGTIARYEVRSYNSTHTYSSICSSHSQCPSFVWGEHSNYHNGNRPKKQKTLSYVRHARTTCSIALSHYILLLRPVTFDICIFSRTNSFYTHNPIPNLALHLSVSIFFSSVLWCAMHVQNETE